MDSKKNVWCAVSVVCIVIAAFAVCFGCPKGCASIPSSTNRVVEISADEQTYAKKTLRTLLSSAQNTYIHRNQTRMAGSIEELGDGFTMGSYGALIYEEIWAARMGCPQKERERRLEKNPKLRASLGRPYRYAILPVKGARSERLDNRTTCLIALPDDPSQIPGLVMIAGPIEKDPQDFSRDWNVISVGSTNDISKIRAWIRKKEFVDSGKIDFLNSISKEKNQ